MSIKSLCGASIAMVIASTIAFAAKDDIRGVRVGMSREEAREILAKDGGECMLRDGGTLIECLFREGADSNEVLAVVGLGQRIWKLQYQFHFHNAPKDMAEFVKAQYGLAKTGQYGSMEIYSTPSGVDATLAPGLGAGDSAVFTLTNAHLKPKPSAMPKF